MRKSLFAVLGVVLAGSALAGAGVASSGATASAPSHVTVHIIGDNHMVPNRSISATYRFPDVIRVKTGGTITFVNDTLDGHTMTMVVSTDLPKSARATFDCGICNTVNSIYGAGNGLPNVLQIDGGHPGDDESNSDADAHDPGVPPGLPVAGLIEDFDTPAHSNHGAPPTIGDSTIIGPVGSPVTQRTILVAAGPGTYHYFCTFHAWMQGTIIVTP